MKTTVRTINIILLIVCFNPVFGQTNLIIPNKGIEGISIVIDSSKISDVIEIYGTDYTLTEKTLMTYYQYDKIGLTFQIDPYDKNQIIRSISVQSPFKARTLNGIFLNESTMKDVWNKYNEKGCFTSNSYAWHSQNGISFYIKKEPNDKGYNTSEKIYKIEINNNGNFGFSSRINFEFNDEPVQEKLNSLIEILESDNFNFDRLEEFWNKEKLSEKKSYGLVKRNVFSRQLENNLTQENIAIRIVGSSYDLNIIKINNDLAYLKLIDDKEQKTVIERIEIPQLEKLDLNIYTYGTFCGIAGTPPDKCQEMLGLVREKKYNELKVWLKSINPEVATYGYIGLEFLNQSGIEIAQTELEQMNKLRKSDIQLNTCQGCIFGVSEKISNVLTKDNLKQIYHLFEQGGWLK